MLQRLVKNSLKHLENHVLALFLTRSIHHKEKQTLLVPLKTSADGDELQVDQRLAGPMLLSPKPNVLINF